MMPLNSIVTSLLLLCVVVAQDPTMIPTAAPSQSPTLSPSALPSVIPSQAPSQIPTYVPSETPTLEPSFAPSHRPSRNPTFRPTSMPSGQPTSTPTAPPSQPDDKDNALTGAGIAGIVLGTIALFFCCGFGVYYFDPKRHRRPQDNSALLAQKNQRENPMVEADEDYHAM